jgi:hypothetical protein
MSRFCAYCIYKRDHRWGHLWQGRMLKSVLGDTPNAAVLTELAEMQKED